MKFMICGACGHMGQVLTQLVSERFPDADIIPVDANPNCEDVYLRPADYPGKVDCILDFSHHSATEAVTGYAAATWTPLVLGTTGQTPEERELIEQASERAPIFFAGNFSVGIALLCRLARQAAKAFPDADIEIVEAHHNRKLDVPSGTALALARAVQQERPDSVLNIGRHENGKRQKQEIDIHSLRMGNVVGMHEIYISTPTQTLVLRHEAHDRKLFAEGALDAAAFLMGKPAGLYDMEDLLEGTL